jgi:hypothetical protein
MFEQVRLSATVAGPIRRASARMRSIVQPAYRRWLDGMCSATAEKKMSQRWKGWLHRHFPSSSKSLGRQPKPAA